MYDDPLDLPRGLGQSVWQLLSSSGEYTYYRPLAFMLWVGLYHVLGRFDPFWFHLTVVLVHGLNALLVALLVLPIGGRIRACAVGLVFAVFPLSYQAVSWAGSLFHPLMTCFLLTALLLYRTHRRSGSTVAAIGTLVVAALALLTHESSVTLGPLVVWYELAWRPFENPGVERQPLSRGFTMAAAQSLWSRWRLAGSVCLFVGAYLLIYRAIPKAHAPFSIDMASIKLNALYLAQGIALLPLGFLNRPYFDTTIIVLTVCGATCAILFAIHGVQRTLRLAAFATGWMVVGWTPSLIALPFTYVVDAPRLLYLSSVGIAMLWGGAFGVPARGWSQRLGAIAGMLAVAAFCIEGWRFVRRHDALYVAGSHLMFAMQSAATRFPDGVLFVNPLSWIGPKQPDYPLGHTGITMIPTYVGLDQVERVAVGRDVKVAWTGYDVLRKPWRYDYGELGGNASLEQLDAFARRSRAVYVTTFGDDLRLEYAGALEPGEYGLSGAQPVLARFDGGVELISASTVSESHDLALDLTWFALAENPTDVTVFVHLDGPDGKPVAQADGYPLLGVSAPRLWKPGDRIRDRRTLALSPGLGQGTYSLGVGLYRRDTGARLGAKDQSGARIASDTVVVASVRLTSDGASITSTRPKG